MKIFRRLASVSVVFGFVVFVAAVLLGASAGYTADNTAELDVSAEISFEDEVETESMPLGPLSKWQMEQFEKNEQMEQAVTENIAKPLTYGSVNYIAEPMAHFTYNNQWIPLQVWQGFGYLGAVVPFGYAGYEVLRVMPDV